MNERDWDERFDQDLDRLLQSSLPADQRDTPAEYQQELEIARRLAQIDFSAGSQQRAALEERLRAQAKVVLPRQARWHTLRLQAAGAGRTLAWTGLAALLILTLNWAFRALLPRDAVQPAGLVTVLPPDSTPQPSRLSKGNVLPTVGAASSQVATSQPAALQTPVRPALTPLATSEVALSYEDRQVGYAFDYPAAWHLNVIDELHVLVTSYDPQIARPASLDSSQTRLELIANHAMESNLLEEMAQLAREETQVLWEQAWTLAGDHPALRIQGQGEAGEWALLLTVLEGRGLRLYGYGDLSWFDAIARSLHPASKTDGREQEPAPTPAVKLLGLTSTSAEIQQRLSVSWQLWSTLWADVRITSQEDLTRREQIWLQQPAQGLWLSGPDGGRPSTLRVKSGRSTVQTNLETKAVRTFNDARLVPSELHKMIFPTWSFALREVEFRPVGQAELAGREVITVEVVNQQNLVTDRLWVDALTGLILRWQDLPATRSGLDVEPSLEIEFTQIVYDAMFPTELFNLEGPLPREFSTDIRLIQDTQP